MDLKEALIFLFFGSIILIACEPSNEEIDKNFQGGLSFSLDTLYFDTLFTERGSATRRFYVRNEHQNALNLSNISLGSSSLSPYTLTVNGKRGKEFNDVLLLGEDSLLVLVDVFIDPKNENMPFLVKDSVNFRTNGILQDVKLVSWGQDANYLGDSVLTCNTHWNNERPYVIYKSILVDSLCSLTIEKGVEAYFAPNSYLYVRGSVHMMGEANSRILLRNDRLEPIYENALGQWGGIIILEGSHDNRFEFATIRNGQVGLRVGSPDNDTIPDVVLKNVIIENMSEAGILSFTSDVYADNTLINNCGNLVVGNIAGGNYTYINSTFSNYSFDFIRESPVAYFSDYLVQDDENTIMEDMNLFMINTIVYGDLENEIVLDFSGETVARLLFSNNMLKTNNVDLDINDNILNEDPAFVSPFNYDYHLDSLSPAINMGANIGLEIDLDSAIRQDNPDIGAYEYIVE